MTRPTYIHTLVTPTDCPLTCWVKGSCGPQNSN